jgi:hypothetical protein
MYFSSGKKKNTRAQRVAKKKRQVAKLEKAAKLKAEEARLNKRLATLRGN